MSCRRLRLRSCAIVSDVTKMRLHAALRQSKERRSAALRLSKKRYPAGPQGYYDPTLMMRAAPKATSFLFEHVPEQEGGSSGSSVSLAALPSWAALRRGRPSLKATELGRPTVDGGLLPCSCVVMEGRPPINSPAG